MQNKINVMHIIRPAAGGMKKHVLSLLEKLDSEIFNPLLVCPSSVLKKYNSDVFYKVINMDINGNINLKKDIFVFNELYKLFLKEKVHIVHTHGAKVGIIGRLAAHKANVPVVINTVHNFFYETAPWHLKYPTMFLHRSLNKITDAQIAVSNALAENIVRIEKFNRKKIHTIYNGISFDDYNFIMECGQLQEIYGIDSNKPVVGVISRLIPQKGVQYFLKAAKIILEILPDVQFVIAGEGPYRKELENIACNLGIKNNVLFLGHVNHVPTLLPLINLCIIPSLSEGMCISALEAMATRKPVIAFRVGGIVEVIENNKNGFLVDKGDYFTLAEKIIKLLKNRRLAESMGKRARSHVEEKFSLQNMVSSIESLYEVLLAEKGISITSQSMVSEVITK